MMRILGQNVLLALFGAILTVLVSYAKQQGVETETITFGLFIFAMSIMVGGFICGLVHDQIENDRKARKDKAVVMSELGINPRLGMLTTFIAVAGFLITLYWAGMEASGQIQHGDPQPPYPEVIVLKK